MNIPTDYLEKPVIWTVSVSRLFDLFMQRLAGPEPDR